MGDVFFLLLRDLIGFIPGNKKVCVHVHTHIYIRSYVCQHDYFKRQVLHDVCSGDDHHEVVIHRMLGLYLISLVSFSRILFSINSMEL